MHYLSELWPLISNMIASGVGASIVLAIIARLIPNDKLYSFGFRLGQTLSRIAVLRFGAAWETVEDFALNSIGKILYGFRAGLQSDDQVAPQQNTESESQEA